MKYIFWGPAFRPGLAMFSEVLQYENVIHIDFKVSPYHIVRVCEVSDILKKIVLRYMERHLDRLSLGKDDDIVFIYYNPWGEFLAKSGFIDKLRTKYKRAVHVVHLIDILIARKMNIDYLKKMFDSVYIYDEKEAESLGISFFPPSYSKNFDTPSENEEITDVSYVGLAKDRMPEIIAVYEKLTKAGLRCKFCIVNADKGERKYEDNITYASKYISEKEYFKEYIAPSRCLLEICNKGTDALTARVREAVMYDKKILSNNEELRYYKYYSEEMMQVYEDADYIDIEFFRKEKKTYQYGGDFSPKYLLKEFAGEHRKLFGRMQADNEIAGEKR